MKRVLAVLVAIALLVGGAYYVKRKYLRGPPEDLALQVVSPDVDFLLSIYTEPSSAQARLLHSLAVHSEELDRETLPGLLGPVVSGYGLEWAEIADDVGSQIAVVGAARGSALLVETDAALEPQEAEFDTERVGPFLAIGDRATLEELSTEGPHLGDADAYVHATRGLEVDDRIAALYRFTSVAPDLPRSLDPVTEMFNVIGGTAAVIRASQGRLEVEGNVLGDGAVLLDDFDPLRWQDTPVDAWLLAHVPNVNRAVQALTRGLRKSRPGAASSLVSLYSALFPGRTEWDADETVVTARGAGFIDYGLRIRARVDKRPQTATGTYTPPAPLQRLAGSVSIQGRVMTVTYGNAGSGSLARSARFSEARSWLEGDMTVVGYLDARAASGVAGVVGAATGVSVDALAGLDRVIVGLRHDTGEQATWRVALTPR